MFCNIDSIFCKVILMLWPKRINNSESEFRIQKTPEIGIWPINWGDIKGILKRQYHASINHYVFAKTWFSFLRIRTVYFTILLFQPLCVCKNETVNLKLFQEIHFTRLKNLIRISYTTKLHSTIIAFMSQHHIKGGS